MVISLKRSQACTATVRVPNPAAGHHRPMPSPETPGHPQTSLQWWSLFLSPWVLVHKVLLYPPTIYFPVLCTFWQVYGGVNANLLQEDLCHTHTQSPCPCSRPLPTRSSTGDAQTQFCLSFCGVLGTWCTPRFFEPSRSFWREWGLILNANSPLLLSCWGFSFALGHGLSPHSCSSAYRSYWGFSYHGRGVSLHGCSSKAQLLLLTLNEGISSRPALLTLKVE